jgi:hypothetical protein
MKKSDLIFFGAVGIGLYLLWKKISGPGSVIDKTETSIANLFPGTSPSVVVQGMINLPDGSTIAASQIQTTWAPGASNPTFEWGGQTYTLFATGSPGTYTAQ